MTTDIQEATTAITSINFLGLDGNPIEGLKVRLNVGGEEQQYVTDAQGHIPPLRAEPGTLVDIDVQRMDGSYKRIETDLTGNSNSVWTFTSPSLVLEVSTELHEGIPGDPKDIIPVWTPADMGVLENSEPPVSDSYRQEGHNHPAPTPKKPAQNKQVQTKQLPDPSRANPPKAGTQAPLQSVRDAKGNPLLVYVEKVKDWWGSWSFPWIHAEHAQVASVQTVIYSGGMEDKVKALIDTATALTEYEIPGSTQTYLIQAKTGKKKLNEYKNKESKTSKGWCYKYVKIALVQSHVVDDALLGESASEAGAELEKQGFIEITKNLPDARWAASGDVIVYRWSDNNWERKKKNDSTKPNYGHIDIRSDEAYISDFIPKERHPIWKDYINIRIYRKIFDPLPTVRMRAFLHCLRDYECQEETDDSKRYDILHTTLPANPDKKRFIGFKVHPWKGIKQLGSGSTAAGAYQITLGTWEDALNSGWQNPALEKELFTPAMQDRVAVVVMETTSGALSLVRVGRIEDGVKALTGRWSSLPGGSANSGRRTVDGKPMDMAYFMSIFSTYFVQEKAKERIQ